MTAILFMFVLLTISALAPWFGSDSRRLSARGRGDFFPALPAAPTR